MPGNPGRPGKRPRFPPAPAICFIIPWTILNCLSRALTSWVVVPLPLAMRSRRDPLMIVKIGRAS